MLHDSHDEDHIHLKPLEFPKPMFGLAIEAATRGQEQKLATALHKLAEEDPGFSIEHNPELNETVVRGLGELHLRVMIERMKERYGVDVNTRPPRIAYRETIGAHAEGHHRHKKQTGGAGQFGEVFLKVEPLDRGAGFEFVDAVKGGTIPGQFLPAVEKGVRQVLHGGAIAGYPAAGRARDRLRRQVPPGRFEGSGLRRRGQEGLPGCDHARRGRRCSSRSSTWR